MSDGPACSPPAPRPSLVAFRTVSLLRLFFEEDRTQYTLPITTALVAPLMIGYLASRLGGDATGGVDRIVAMGMTTAFIMPVTQVGAAVMFDRFDQRVALIRLLGVPKAAYFLARVGVGVAECLIVLAVGMLLMHLGGLAAFSAGTALAAAGVTLVAAVGLCALGVLGAAVGRDRDGAWTLVTLASLGLAFTSPVLYAEASLPGWARPLAWLSPFTHLLPQFQALLDHDPLPIVRLAALGALSLGFTGWAYRRLSW